MTAAFLLIVAVTLLTAAVALSLRNLIHSALLLVASWAGIAAFYLWAGIEFIAFAQALVYVGAVSMVVLFAVLLTGRSQPEPAIGSDSVRRVAGAMLVGGAVLGVLFGAVLGTDLPIRPAPPPAMPVSELGRQLMIAHTASVLVIGVILTVALLGAVVLAANDRDHPKEDEP